VLADAGLTHGAGAACAAVSTRELPANERQRNCRALKQEPRRTARKGELPGQTSEQGSTIQGQAPLGVGRARLAYSSARLKACARPPPLKDSTARTEEERRTQEKRGDMKKQTKSDSKTQRITPKFCTDEIHHATNLIPKNHRLRLIQTPGKSNRGQERKTFPKNENHSTSEERKSQTRMMNPGGQKEDLGLHSHTKSPQIHSRIFRFFRPPS
jgi:hypothetical protein